MSLMIDIFVAILLISAIGYGMVLNRRIVALRRDQADLERLAVSFNEATTRAEASVGNLKKAAQSSAQILNEGLDDAVKVREDLNYLIERGMKLADQLETSVRGAEKLPQPKQQTAHNMAKNDHGLRSVINPVEPANEFAIAETSQNFTNSNLRPKSSPKKGLNAETLGNEIVKSEAERELIKALQAVR